MLSIQQIILGFACAFVIMGFCVPIIIYAVDSNRGGEYSTISLAVEVDNCTTSQPTVSQHRLINTVIPYNKIVYHFIFTQSSMAGNECGPFTRF